MSVSGLALRIALLIGKYPFDCPLHTPSPSDLRVQKEPDNRPLANGMARVFQLFHVASQVFLQQEEFVSDLRAQGQRKGVQPGFDFVREDDA